MPAFLHGKVKWCRAIDAWEFITNDFFRQWTGYCLRKYTRASEPSSRFTEFDLGEQGRKEKTGTYRVMRQQIRGAQLLWTHIVSSQFDPFFFLLPLHFWLCFFLYTVYLFYLSFFEFFTRGRKKIQIRCFCYFSIDFSSHAKLAPVYCCTVFRTIRTSCEFCRPYKNLFPREGMSEI